MSLSDHETIALRQLEQHRQHTESLSAQVRSQAERIAVLERENAAAHDANARLSGELEDLRNAAGVETHGDLFDVVRTARQVLGVSEGARRLPGSSATGASGAPKG